MRIKLALFSCPCRAEIKSVDGSVDLCTFVFLDSLMNILIGSGGTVPYQGKVLLLLLFKAALATRRQSPCMYVHIKVSQNLVHPIYICVDWKDECNMH